MQSPMRRGWMRGAMAGLVLLAVSVPALSAGTWQTIRIGADKKTLPKGKTLSRSVSPDRRYVLLVRDEGEKGDFFWRSVYLQHGSSYTPLGACNQLRGARWSRSPVRVRFETDAATGPSEMERSERVYTPSRRALRKRTVRTLRVEGAG